jgi:hypothetical protein
MIATGEMGQGSNSVNASLDNPCIGNPEKTAAIPAVNSCTESPSSITQSPIDASDKRNLLRVFSCRKTGARKDDHRHV